MISSTLTRPTLDNVIDRVLVIGSIVTYGNYTVYNVHYIANFVRIYNVSCTLLCTKCTFYTYKITLYSLCIEVNNNSIHYTRLH